MDKLGFIGAGNMGSAMIARISQKLGKESVSYWDKDPRQNSAVTEMTGIQPEASLPLLINNCRYIVCAVKPQHVFELLENMRSLITKEHIFISVAPGITISEYQTFLPCPIVRAMPNIAALVGEAMSVLAFSKDFTDEGKREFIVGVFNTIGKSAIFDERFVDSAIPLSGSSPAYIFMMIDAMADAGVKLGIPRGIAETMIAQSIYGAAKLFIETGDHPSELKDKVCSPGGTTIEAVATLERSGFRAAIIDAVDACFEKIRNLKK